MIKVNQIKLSYAHTEDALRQAILKKMHIAPEDLIEYHILRQSIDARQSGRGGHAGQIFYQYAVAVKLKNEGRYLKKNREKDIVPYKPTVYVPPIKAVSVPKEPPIIIGSGPAGLFCGLMLARAGYAPIIVERGSDVRTRMEKVAHFWKTGELDTECNVQFGEGGAGTFSDGKLNTLVSDASGRHQKVLELFVEAGAPKEILYMQKPHLGTDALVELVAHMRDEIIALGGKVLFNTKVTDFLTDKNGHLCGLEINDNFFMSTRIAVLAIGHSARDTFERLYERKVFMEQKPFAIGVRIEHAQDFIDQAQYGAALEVFKGQNDANVSLPAADYKLTYRTHDGRSVYTFCMCPGGYVVNASSEDERTAVNGMSYRNRDGQNANSAVIVGVEPADFKSSHPLAGVTFQRKWERMAWKEGHGKIPVQLFGDFCNDTCSTKYGHVIPNHCGQDCFAKLNNCLPEYVCESLKEGIHAFGQKIQGFDADDAVLSGVETRTSSPVRIVRDECLQSNIKGIYPCGEGAGYAGGITSAAMDGLKVAEYVAKALYTGDL